jgi:phosphoserine phosphatase RsbU/P
LPAALVMSNIQAGLRSSLTYGVLDPAEILSRLNQLVCTNTAVGTFVSMFIAVYSRERRQLLGARAGHEYPMLVRRDGLEVLTVGGPILGCVPDACFEGYTVDLNHGDVLLLYTDGISDAADSSLTNFGAERVADAVVRHHGKSAESLGRSILEDVTAFTDGAEYNDDVTLLLLRVTEPELANVD